MTSATIAVSGESALRLTGTTGDAESDWLLVHKIARYLEAAKFDGIIGCIPTYESVLVEFDAMTTTSESVAGYLEAIIGNLDLSTPLTTTPKHFRVPVFYGGEYGPDLDEVAEITGLSPEEVIAVHSAPTYLIRCLGSPGGSPMLDGPAFPVPVPRLASPRLKVPQGSIAVAGRQATLAPAVAPGGWRVIGRTPHTILDLSQEPLAPYEPGDTLSFHPIGSDEFHALAGTRLAAQEPS